MLELTTSDLLYNNYPVEYADKVYLCAKIKQQNNLITVHLSSSDPVVWMSDKIKAQHTGFTVKELQNDNHSGFSLLSAGAFIETNGKLVVLKRDALAMSAPNRLTEPCGRCSELPSLTILKELNEELLVVNKDTSYALIPTPEEYVETLFEIKKSQLLGANSKIVNVEALPIFELAVSARYNTVEVYLDSALVGKIKGYSYWDESCNTLEVRKVYHIPNGHLLTFLDAEPYNREVFVLSPSQIKEKPCCNALFWFVNNFF